MNLMIVSNYNNKKDVTPTIIEKRPQLFNNKIQIWQILSTTRESQFGKNRLDVFIKTIQENRKISLNNNR